MIKFKYILLLIIVGIFVLVSIYILNERADLKQQRDYLINARITCTKSVEDQLYKAWQYGEQNHATLGNKAFDEQTRLNYIGRNELRRRCLETWGLE